MSGAGQPTPEVAAVRGFPPDRQASTLSFLIASHRQFAVGRRLSTRKELELYGYSTLRQFGEDIADINRENLRRVYQELQSGGAKQIKRRMALVKRILDWAADPLKGFLESHPLPALKVPKDETERRDSRTFTLDEARAILKAVEDSEWHLPLLLYFETGVRKMALMLRVGADWDSQSRILTVRKEEGNKVDHEDALPVGLIAARRIACLGPLDPLFPSSSGGFHGPKAPWEALQKACKAAGVPPGGVHAMRRCCASEVSRITGECSVASLALGHNDGKKSLAQSTYIRVGPEDAREAVEALERKLLEVT